MLAALFSGTVGYACAGTFATAEDALKQLNLRTVDLLLVDIGLKGISGIEYVSRVKEQKPNLPVLIYTIWEDFDQIVQALQAGANGYVLKRTSHPELFAAISEVLAGGAPMSRTVGAQVVRHFRRKGEVLAEIDCLSERQREVLDLVSRGQSYDEIAKCLHISAETVRKHLQMICLKLNVATRAEAIAKFARAQA